MCYDLRTFGDYMRMCKEIIGEEKKELKRKKWYKLCRKVVLTRVFKLWKGVQFLISTGKIPSLTHDEREEKKREVKKEKGIQALENDDGAAGSSTRTTIGLSPSSGKSVASRGLQRRKKTEKTTPRSTSSGKKRKVRFEDEDRENEKTSSPAAVAFSDDDLPSTASEKSSSENSSDESSSTSDEESTSSDVDSSTGDSKKKRKSKGKITNADGTTSTDSQLMGHDPSQGMSNRDEDEKLKTSENTDHRDAGGSLGGTGNYMHMIGLDNVCRFRQALQRVMNKCSLATGNYVSAYVKKLEEKFAKGEIAAAGDEDLEEIVAGGGGEDHSPAILATKMNSSDKNDTRLLTPEELKRLESVSTVNFVLYTYKKCCLCTTKLAFNLSQHDTFDTQSSRSL